MRQYLELLARTYSLGVRQKNRTGVDTFMVPGGMMQFDLGDGFPILTTKKVNFGSVVGELLAFIRGCDSAADFRALGCNIWDKNANGNQQWMENENRKGIDDLGRVYGVQWRDWRAIDAVSDKHTIGLDRLDQFARMLNMIEKDPTSRRIIVNAWRPDELHLMALPPCHMMFQVLVEQEAHKLHMTMYMRSCDMFLGVPFNISSYALLLSLISQATGYRPGILTMFLADVHIYENHRPQVQEQLNRNTRMRPRLILPEIKRGDDAPLSPLDWIESLHPIEIILQGYDPSPAIKGEMAV